MIDVTEARHALPDGALIGDLHDNGVPLPHVVLGPDELALRAAGARHLHAPCTGLLVSWGSRPEGIHLDAALIPMVNSQATGADLPPGPSTVVPAPGGVGRQGPRGGTAPCTRRHSRSRE